MCLVQAIGQYRGGEMGHKTMEDSGKKKMVEAITSMEEDFAKWYTDIVKKAELIDYSSVRGCMYDPAVRICDLGEHPEKPGWHIQGDGA